MRAVTEMTAASQEVARNAANAAEHAQSTGDYSRGAVGHWVENGEIAYPVHEVTIAGNLRDLYQRIAAIGDDQDQRSGIRCGSILVEEMTIAGA